jgi:hypothetical protein
MNKQTFNDSIIKELNGFEVFKSLFKKVLIETKYNFLKLKKVAFFKWNGWCLIVSLIGWAPEIIEDNNSFMS